MNFHMNHSFRWRCGSRTQTWRVTLRVVKFQLSLHRCSSYVYYYESSIHWCDHFQHHTHHFFNKVQTLKRTHSKSLSDVVKFLKPWGAVLLFRMLNILYWICDFGELIKQSAWRKLLWDRDIRAESNHTLTVKFIRINKCATMVFICHVLPERPDIDSVKWRRNLLALCWDSTASRRLSRILCSSSSRAVDGDAAFGWGEVLLKFSWTVSTKAHTDRRPGEEYKISNSCSFNFLLLLLLVGFLLVFTWLLLEWMFN